LGVTANNVATTPLPTAISLFTSGLAALGLLGWRRKKKAAALAT
jgi:LPXTG-motif cell wall-anchored protein